MCSNKKIKKLQNDTFKKKKMLSLHPQKNYGEVAQLVRAHDS